LEIVARDRRLRRHPSIAPRYSARTTLRLLMLLQTALTFFNPTPLKRGPQRNHKSLRHLLGVLSIPPRPKRRPQLWSSSSSRCTTSNFNLTPRRAGRSTSHQSHEPHNVGRLSIRPRRSEDGAAMSWSNRGSMTTFNLTPRSEDSNEYDRSRRSASGTSILPRRRGLSQHRFLKTALGH
jgi:hypothetical protein